MKDEIRRFQYGSMSIQFVGCVQQKRSAVLDCVPPTCYAKTLCNPAETTLALVRFQPGAPAELKRLLVQLERLKMPVGILAEPGQFGEVEESLKGP